MAVELLVWCPECEGRGNNPGPYWKDAAEILHVEGPRCEACEGKGVVPATEEQIEEASAEITKRKMAEFMDRTGHYD